MRIDCGDITRLRGKRTRCSTNTPEKILEAPASTFPVRSWRPAGPTNENVKDATKEHAPIRCRYRLRPASSC